MALDAIFFEQSIISRAEALIRTVQQRSLEVAATELDAITAEVKKLNLSPAQVAMIVQSPQAAEACRNAGVVCLGVSCGGHSATSLLGSGARSVWKDCADLEAQFDRALEIASPNPIHWTWDWLHKLMREALAEARRAMDAGEVPIACVLARGDGSIVARGFNEMNRTKNKTAHAEIVTFAHAAGKVPLEARDLVLVSTLEPCVMCTGAAMEAAVDMIVYALKAPADSGTNRVRPPQSPESQMPRIVGNVLADESRKLFELWLRDNSNTPQARYVKQLLSQTD